MAAHEVGHEIHHHYATLRFHEVKNFVWDVARVRAQCVGAAVTENRGRGAAGPVVVAATEHIEHGIATDVCEVNKDAKAVHLLDDLPASRADASPERSGLFDIAAGELGHGGVGVDVVAVMGEGCVAHAEGVVAAEGRGGVADLVEAFDGEGGDELVGAEVGEGGCAVGGWGEVGGVDGLEAAEEVELAVCCCDGWGVLGCDCND